MGTPGPRLYPEVGAILVLKSRAQRAAMATAAAAPAWEVVHSPGIFVRDSPATSGAELKDSIGEGSNHSNFSHQSSVKILSKLNAFCQEI